MLRKNNEMGKYVNNDGKSRFSYIRPIDRTTRLIVYNYSNITGMEGIVYHENRNYCISVWWFHNIFTSDAFHVGIMSYDRKGSAYLHHLPMFACIVEEYYISIRVDISKIIKKWNTRLTVRHVEKFQMKKIIMRDA